MADNSTLPATGDVIAADEIAGVKYQRVKPTFGDDGFAVDVSATNPMPIVLTQGEVVEALQAIRIALHSLSRSMGQAMPDTAGRLRVSVDAGTLPTVTTVTTLATLANQTQIGGNAACEQIPALMRLGADSIRRNVSVT
jgi:hypothetical protein